MMLKHRPETCATQHNAIGNLLAHEKLPRDPGFHQKPTSKQKQHIRLLDKQSDGKCKSVKMTAFISLGQLIA